MGWGLSVVSQSTRNVEMRSVRRKSYLDKKGEKKIMKGGRGEGGTARVSERERRGEIKIEAWDEKGNSSVIGCWIWIIGWCTMEASEALDD